MDVKPADRLTRCLLEARRDLLRFLKRRADPAIAEDILQEVWIKLHTRSDPQSWQEPRAVVFTTAANLATDARRHAAAADRMLSHESMYVETTSEALEPEAHLETTGRLERIAAALQELPDLCRAAFLMNRFEGLTHAQIAARLGVSTKTVQRYIERALLQCLQADGT
jgi:RNA polymerase sigma factor (sigma-70 family)